jgi:hypothetical protein
MQRIALSVAILALASGAGALAESPKASVAIKPHTQAIVVQDPSKTPEELKIFTGQITKAGDLFVLTDDSTKSAYNLDDQDSAGKFAGKRVRVTGVLDATNNTIRIQSIEEANA